MIEVQCSYCGVRSCNQHPGDGCYACLQGVMREVKNIRGRLLYCINKPGGYHAKYYFKGLVISL